MTPLGPPGPDEYAPGYAGYVARLPAGADLLQSLAGQLDTTAGRLGAVPESRGAYRYAPEKWSVKEVVLHLTDTERIMAYRALRIARGDTTPLAGFDENAYAPLSGADAQPLDALVSGWGDVRRATLSLFRQLPPEAWTRRGLANGSPVSVRALGWIIAGHERHHLEVLGARYGLWPVSG
ncbi:MAG TPA: DinB family protein [Gemmatimonadales bacterium]|nr:DinB family protein [Gemmatimonadales bacterium]